MCAGLAAEYATLPGPRLVSLTSLAVRGIQIKSAHSLGEDALFYKPFFHPSIFL